MLVEQAVGLYRSPEFVVRANQRQGGRLMLETLLSFSESRLGPLWGPAIYELVTSLFFIICIVVPLLTAAAVSRNRLSSQM